MVGVGGVVAHHHLEDDLGVDARLLAGCAEQLERRAHQDAAEVDQQVAELWAGTTRGWVVGGGAPGLSRSSIRCRASPRRAMASCMSWALGTSVREMRIDAALRARYSASAW